MAYTTPKTWTNEPLLASDLNTHLRDNMDAIKDPPFDEAYINEATDYTTASTSLVDVDATEGKFQHTITTNGGDIMVWFCVSMEQSSTNQVYFEIDVDGSPLGGDDGLYTVKNHTAGARAGIWATWLGFVTGLSAGSHVFKLQWATNTGTATLYAGAATAGRDVHPNFGVREVS